MKAKQGQENWIGYMYVYIQEWTNLGRTKTAAAVESACGQFGILIRYKNRPNLQTHTQHTLGFKLNLMQ